VRALRSDALDEPTRVQERPSATAHGRAAFVRLPLDVRRAFDVIAVVALAISAYVARRGTLPGDGLWFDDSWVAAGAIHGTPFALLSHGSGTPGYTAILMAVHDLGGGLRELGIPSLVAGIAGPALLYVALRSLGFERAIAAVVSAPLVIAHVHVLYSGRVKGYTFDALWVLLLVIALPRLARRTWRWPHALAWFLAAVIIGTFSAYTMVTVAVAGIVLVLNARSDRLVRLAAVAAQGFVQALYFAASSSRADFSGIEEALDRRFDAHLEFSWNPIMLAQESLAHLRRVAEVFPGGSSAWLTIFGLTAIGGLAWAAVKGNRTTRVAGQLLLFLVLLAYLGGFAHRFPFGPSNDVTLSAGGRHTLWLVPAMAFGLAVVAHQMRRLMSRYGSFRFAFDAAAVAAAVAIVLVGYTPAQPAPFQGSETAAKFIDRSLRPDDVVIITTSSTYAYANSTQVPVRLVATPDYQIGFVPEYEDPRVHVAGAWTSEPDAPEDVRRWVGNARRVFVMAGGALGAGGLEPIAGILRPLGFTMTPRAFGWNVVQVWER
jgi:hypothetical protein